MRIILRVEIMDRKRVQNKKTDYFVKPLFIISVTLKKILYLCLLYRQFQVSAKTDIIKTSEI